MNGAGFGRACGIWMFSFLVACGGDDDGAPRDAGGGDDAGPPIDAGPATDTGPAPDGGSAAFTVTSADGVVTLNVPAGALPPGVAPGDLAVTLESTPELALLDVSADDALAGRFTAADEILPFLSYALEPAGTEFLGPVTVTVRLDEATLPDGAFFTLLSEGVIDHPPIMAVRQPDAATREVDLEVAHFSELDAFSNRPLVTATQTAPAAGAMVRVAASFTNTIDVTRMPGGTERVYRDLDRIAGRNVESITIERVVPTSMWSVRATSYHYEPLDPLTVESAARSVTGDTTTLTIGPIWCTHTGVGNQTFNIYPTITIDQVVVPVVDGIPGAPGPVVEKESTPQIHFVRAVACVATISAPARAVGARMLAMPSDLFVAARTSFGAWLRYDDGGTGAACTHDGTCGARGACIDGRCGRLEPPRAGADVRWTTSDPGVLTISNDPATLGEVNVIAPGTADVGCEYRDETGTIPCSTPSTATAAGATSIRITVVPRMLCDLIVTTRPYSPGANGTVFADGSTDAVRMGSTLGIDDAGSVTDYLRGADRPAYHPHAFRPAIGASTDTDVHVGNDPRVLLPNVAGLTQPYLAIGYFSRDGTAGGCGADPARMFAVDVTREAIWDVVSSRVDGADVASAALGAAAAVTVEPGRATVVAGPADSDRIQAIRATIDTGPRSCTGNGTAVGARSATSPCRHALPFEVCGTPATGAGSLEVTGWDDPGPDHRSDFFPAGLPNAPLEDTAPATGDTAWYGALAGSEYVQYYALQRIVAPAGGCALSGGDYVLDVTTRATWSSSTGTVATVSNGLMHSLDVGTTDIQATIGAVTDLLPFEGYTACSSLFGTWTCGLRFVPRPNMCMSPTFTDTVEFTFASDGTASTRQPSTGDVDTGTWMTMGEQCVVGAMSADGRERYDFNVAVGLSNRLTGTNEYTSVAGCSTTFDINCTLTRVP